MITPSASALTVSFGSSDDVTRARHQAALATLATSFRPARDAIADVTVVSGVPPDWPQAVAATVSAGARGVLVARPRPTDPAVLRDVIALGSEAGAAIAVDSPLRLDPAWEQALPRIRESLARAVLLDTVTVLDAALADAGAGDTAGLLGEGLLEQAALVRSVTARVDDVRGSRDGSAYQLSAAADGLALTMAGAISTIGAPRCRLDLVAPTEHWQVRFDPSTPAGATRVARYGAGGGEIQPTLYERGQRAVWRHLAAAIAHGRPLPYSLGDLADDIEFIRDATLGGPARDGTETFRQSRGEEQDTWPDG